MKVDHPAAGAQADFSPPPPLYPPPSVGWGGGPASPGAPASSLFQPVGGGGAGPLGPLSKALALALINAPEVRIADERLPGFRSNLK